MPDRAEATRAELDVPHPGEASRETLECIGCELGRTLREVESRLAKTREALAARPNIRILQELEAELSELQERLRPWDEELDSQLAGLHAALRRLDTIAAVWEATAEVARVFVVVASVSIWVETLEELKVLVSAYGEWPRRVGRFIQYAL